MRVLVAGATNVPGLPLLREVNARGHDVVGLARQSVIFAYGYPTTGPAVMDESDPYPGPPPPGGGPMLKALRDMEQTVLTSGQHSDTEGIVLRYGLFYGPGVPHDELFTRLVRWWAMPALTGTGVVSWV